MNYKQFLTVSGTVLTFLAFFAATLAVIRAQTPEQPVAPVREITDDYFGQKIVDPYRWMEEPHSGELAGWLKAQNDFTRAYLDRLPLRAQFLKRLAAQI